ncbi:putative glycosyltransferase 7 [Nicotiana tomentosiformis]|uniref:putative glycosyltransferase 7 n=1 Tax=Nicotiana tomentosiformis TaxID=4098 RepID=UPI00051BC211|nr:putative glycosyltransferase 7 [Nicotiana tomentosiformis]
MVTPQLVQTQTSYSSMAPKQNCKSKVTSLFSDGFLCAGGSIVALLVVWAFWSFMSTSPNTDPSFFSTSAAKKSTLETPGELTSPGFDLRYDPPDPTFYDDPDVSYTIEKPVKNWDEKRRQWLKLHPSFVPGVENRVLMVSGSQSTPCKNPIGDHLLLRFFKNKVDYCRIHGYDIFYNNILLQPKMWSFWAKMPAVKAAMLAHPEAEWIWWVDSDAAFTDMDFKLPLDRYKAHNFVVHGWEKLIYEQKSWTSINAGVFLIRNCQWSMDLMEAWAKMGPQSPEYDKWGEILRSTFKDKIFQESDDQSGLAYLLLKEKEKWGDKIYVEGQYYFEGYWVEIVGTLDNITDKYLGIEKVVPSLRRRHGEKVSESYGKVWEEHLKDAGYGRYSWRRPFITHFTGCQPCSGDHNQMYSGETCFDAMQKALNFADNQVLRKYGYMHKDLLDSSSVFPVPFDFPA